MPVLKIESPVVILLVPVFKKITSLAPPPPIIIVHGLLPFHRAGLLFSVLVSKSVLHSASLPLDLFF